MNYKQEECFELPFPLLCQQNDIVHRQCHNIKDIILQQLHQCLPFHQFIETNPIGCIICWIIYDNCCVAIHYRRYIWILSIVIEAV